MMIEGIDLTLGVEEEYQIINPETRDLDSYVRQFLEKGGQFTPYSSLKPELMQSQIEAGSSVCSSVHEVRSEIIRMRRLVRKLAAEHGMAVASAGTHPFADWSKQTFTAGERYARFLNDMAGVANQLLIFGGLGLPGFGIEGAGAATALTRLCLLVGLVLVLGEAPVVGPLDVGDEHVAELEPADVRGPPSGVDGRGSASGASACRPSCHAGRW